MGVSAPDPSMMGGAADAGPPPGQSAQVLQQIQSLFAQVMQNESDPQVQATLKTLMQGTDALMQAVGGQDTQDMTSGLNNPGGMEGSPAEEAGESPAVEASEDEGTGGGKSPKTFKQATKNAKKRMAKAGSK